MSNFVSYKSYTTNQNIVSQLCPLAIVAFWPANIENDQQWSVLVANQEWVSKLENLEKN